MTQVANALVGLSALAFVLAVAANFDAVPFIPVTSEGLSDPSSNLALLAIALLLAFRAQRVQEGRTGEG